MRDPVPDMAGEPGAKVPPSLQKWVGKESGAGAVLVQVRSVWAIVQVVVEEAIVAAETLLSGKSGSEKKQFVEDEVMKFLREAEGKFDVLPPGIEKLVFSAVGWTLDWLVEGAFRRLKDSGRLGS